MYRSATLNTHPMPRCDDVEVAEEDHTKVLKLNSPLSNFLKGALFSRLSNLEVPQEFNENPSSSSSREALSALTFYPARMKVTIVADNAPGCCRRRYKENVDISIDSIECARRSRWLSSEDDTKCGDSCITRPPSPPRRRNSLTETSSSSIDDGAVPFSSFSSRWGETSLLSITKIANLPCRPTITRSSSETTITATVTASYSTNNAQRQRSSLPPRHPHRCMEQEQAPDDDDDDDDDDHVLDDDIDKNVYATTLILVTDDRRITKRNLLAPYWNSSIINPF